MRSITLVVLKLKLSSNGNLHQCCTGTVADEPVQLYTVYSIEQEEGAVVFSFKREERREAKKRKKGRIPGPWRAPRFALTYTVILVSACYNRRPHLH